MSWSRARLCCSERKLNTRTITSNRATIPNTLLVVGKDLTACQAAEGKAPRKEGREESLDINDGRPTLPIDFSIPAEAAGTALRERLSKAPVLSLRPTPTTRDPVLMCGQAWVAAARHINWTLWVRANNMVCQPALRIINGFRGFKVSVDTTAACRVRGAGVEVSWRDCTI